MSKGPARNPVAIGAMVRSGAGPHKDGRKGRGGTKNDQSEFLDEYLELKAEVSGSHPIESVIDL